MNDEKVMLIRYSTIPFTVNYENKKYVWAGTKGEVISKKEVPMDVYNYLTSFTTTFKDGELALEESENIEELKEDMIDREEYEVNSISKEELIKLLKGNYNKMMSELNKVTSESTKKYVYETAKEIKIDNANKQKFIKDWMGSMLSIEELFSEE